MSTRSPLIILPTYDERDNLESIVAAALAALPEAHLLVVDDNSPDGTGELAERLAADDPRVHVLHRPGKQGLGRAYLAGFDWALARDYDRVFEMDADFSHDPKYLRAMLDAAEHHDVVIGSRYVPGGGTRGWSLPRRVLSRGGSLYARTILGMHVHDMTGGLVCYRREALAQLGLAEVSSTGFVFQIELKYRAHLRGLSIIELPIVFPDRVR
ncbi:MAG TPA: polyprenol monophosphomannose synthase, partial [Enhygromyxa sp.]|nr:polyprenol monophosphomannose synthase [Enhygromyxa sp.]